MLQAASADGGSDCGSPGWDFAALRHRIYRCPHLKPLRTSEAPSDMIARDLAYPVAHTDLALARALFPVPFTRVPHIAKQASFH